MSETLDLLNYTTIFIGFKDVTCIRYRRSVYMTWDNFLGIKILIFKIAKIHCIKVYVLFSISWRYFWSLFRCIYFVIIRIFGRILFNTLNTETVMKSKQLKNNDKLKSSKHIMHNRRIHSHFGNLTATKKFSKHQYIE